MTPKDAGLNPHEGYNFLYLKIYHCLWIIKIKLCLLWHALVLTDTE